MSTNIIGSFPKSIKGNTYVLTVTDYFSKFSLCFLSEKATTAPLKVYVFLLFGVPEILICDNGKQYTTKDFKALLQQYNVKTMYYALCHFQNNPV